MRPRFVAVCVAGLVFAGALAAGTVAGHTAGPTRVAAAPAGPCGTKVGHRPAHYRHVVWIVFENKSYGDIVGSGSAPYLNRLASRCGLAAQYYGVAHPSLPNYLALTSGSTQGVTDDNGPDSNPVPAPSIFSQLGTGWSVHAESMPSPCYRSDSYPYSVHHNPAAYYTDIRAACATQDVAGGISATARFTFVTPNQCHNMHDCSVASADRWLAKSLLPLLASRAYTGGGTAIFITWDEDDLSSQNHVATLMISPYTRRGTKSYVRFTHYSLLKTTELMLGLGCLAKACGASSMRAPFGL